MSIALAAQTREQLGTSHTRRMRHADEVPVVVYGPGKDPLHLSVSHHTVIKFVNDVDFHTQPVTLNIEGQKKPLVVKLQQLQRHKTKPKVLHLDFMYT